MGVLKEGPGFPLWSDHTSFVRRHRARIGALMVLGLAAGFAWSLLQPSSYSATTSVVLTPVPVYITSSTTEPVAPAVSIDTDAQLLRSPRVLAAAADARDPDGEDGQAISERLQVTASPSTNVLHVTVSASSPSAAAAAADAAVAEFVDIRRDALGSLREEQLDELRLRLSQHEELLARQQRQRLVIPSTDELHHQVLQLRASLQELEAAQQLPAEVIRAAVAPTSADYANSEVPLTSGAMLGLVAGCLLGAARDRAGRSTHPRRTPPTQSFRPGQSPGVATRPEEYDHAS